MKSLDYTTIYNVLMDLLQIPDGNPLPSGSGVCLEVGKATRLTEWCSPITEEYTWISDHARQFGMAGVYICCKGLMSPKRREFIRYLLKMLENQQGASSD